MGTLSNSFYNNLYATAPGQLRRDGKGLSAVCLLPPKIKITSRPQSALITRKETPSGPPYARSIRPQSAKPSMPQARATVTAANVIEADRLEVKSRRSRRPKSANPKMQNNNTASRMTPLGTCIDSRPGTADSFEDKVAHYRAQPITQSRKCWNRINPGHMLEHWDSTNRKVQNPDFGLKPYQMQKEHHLPKTDIMTYVNDMIKMKVSVKTGFR